MAVVVDPADVEEFLKYAREENLEAVEVAVVTETPRLVLIWRDKEIVNISRAFLDTNGAHQETNVFVEIPSEKDNYFAKESVADVKEKWLEDPGRLKRMLPKGTCGDVRQLYRGWQCADALWWKISADRDAGHGSKASSTER